MGPILKIFYDFQNIELVNPEDVLVRAMNFYSEKCIRNRKNKRFPIFIMATLRRQLDFSIVFFCPVILLCTKILIYAKPFQRIFSHY